MTEEWKYISEERCEQLFIDEKAQNRYRKYVNDEFVTPEHGMSVTDFYNTIVKYLDNFHIISMYGEDDLAIGHYEYFSKKIDFTPEELKVIQTLLMTGYIPEQLMLDVKYKVDAFLNDTGA